MQTKHSMKEKKWLVLEIKPINLFGLLKETMPSVEISDLDTTLVKSGARKVIFYSF